MLIDFVCSSIMLSVLLIPIRAADEVGKLYKIVSDCVID